MDHSLSEWNSPISLNKYAYPIVLDFKWNSLIFITVIAYKLY